MSASVLASATLAWISYSHQPPTPTTTTPPLSGFQSIPSVHSTPRLHPNTCPPPPRRLTSGSLNICLPRGSSEVRATVSWKGNSAHLRSKKLLSCLQSNSCEVFCFVFSFLDWKITMQAKKKKKKNPRQFMISPGVLGLVWFKTRVGKKKICSRSNHTQSGGNFSPLPVSRFAAKRGHAPLQTCADAVELQPLSFFFFFTPAPTHSLNSCHYAPSFPTFSFYSAFALFFFFLKVEGEKEGAWTEGSVEVPGSDEENCNSSRFCATVSTPLPPSPSICAVSPQHSPV